MEEPDHWGRVTSPSFLESPLMGDRVNGMCRNPSISGN